MATRNNVTTQFWKIVKELIDVFRNTVSSKKHLTGVDYIVESISTQLANFCCHTISQQFLRYFLCEHNPWRTIVSAS